MMSTHWIIISTLLLLPSLFAQEIRSVALREVSISTQDRSEICQQLPRCDSASGTLYKRLSPTEYYFIDDLLQIARFTKEENYQLKQYWDFADYVHESKILDGADYQVNLYIEPKLYPLNHTKWGVALVKYGSGAYSGGGIREEKADIVQLNEDGSYQTALNDIPFYYESLIRACFREEDADSPHCHDEKERTLNIQYRDIGKPYYQWEIIYTFTDWPAHIPQSKATIYEKKQQRVPFESLDKRSDP
ncbi:hypothetical protein A1D29_10100 [Pasteurellaceae bacterium Orientalotternb1]|nr:hypothetical protein A1D29_10100 [Pasteurellaceae bacterium Orientalotternb1]